jgi:tRNA modification GTPase
MNQSVRRMVEDVSEELTCLLARIEALADFPEEVDEAEAALDLEKGIRSALAALEGALDERAARFLREGLAVVIAGPPNAGKSSLMNAILKSDRAIVRRCPAPPGSGWPSGAGTGASKSR